MVTPSLALRPDWRSEASHARPHDINGANETAVTATDPQTLNADFDATSYVGAVRDADDTWYAGWTCNSDTATFDADSTDCTSLPPL